MRASFPGWVVAFLLALAVLAPLPACAADVSLVAGRSRTTDHRWTTSAFVNITSDQAFTWGRLQLKPVATVGWIKHRPPGREHLDHNVYVGGAGLRLVHWWHGAFASFQLGAADGRTDALSSGGQFLSTLGWHGQHWVVMLRHISNGNLFGGKNLGETMVMVGLRF